MSDNPDRNMKTEKYCSQLQDCYEHLRNVREILIKEQQQRSVQTKLDSFFKSALLRSKTSKTSESSIG
jgi:hypothetical protein